MKTSEFMELVDAAGDAKRSLQSCQATERDAECARVQMAVRRLRDAEWPSRLSADDKAKALRVITQANTEVVKAFDAMEDRGECKHDFVRSLDGGTLICRKCGGWS